jgi:hypothetical protein
MEQNLNTPFARRAQHQQRRATVALEECLQQQLQAARAIGAHLDLELIIATGTRCHLRVSTVADGLLTGIMLVGFRFDSQRQCAGPTAIRISRIVMAERIIDAGGII